MKTNRKQLSKKATAKMLNVSKVVRPGNERETFKELGYKVPEKIKVKKVRFYVHSIDWNLNVRKFESHEDLIHEATTGTSLQDQIQITYRQIIAMFGEPTFKGSPDGKIKAEWVVFTPEGVATIYDYKEYDKTPESVTDWHLGGHNQRSVAFIVSLINKLNEPVSR